MAQIEEEFTWKEISFMIKQLQSRGNLLLALKQLEKNKGSHGVEGMTVKSLRRHFMDNWNNLRKSIEYGTYTPMLVHLIESRSRMVAYGY